MPDAIMILVEHDRKLFESLSSGETAMKNKKTIGIALLVIGVVVVLGSLAADSIGIGAAPGFGYKQIIGSLAGIVIAVTGFILYSRK